MITDQRFQQRLSALACSLLLAGITAVPSAMAQQGSARISNPVEQVDPFSPPRPPAPPLPEVPGQPAQTGRPGPAGAPAQRSVRAITLPPSRGERISAPVRLSAEQQRQVESAVRLTRQLADESLDSYRRGLLPLEDLAEMQAAAVSLQRSVSRLTGRDGDLAVALDRQARQLATAAAELRDIRQPGAWNYDADMTLSQLLALDARRSLAEFRGDRQGVAAAMSQRSELARQNWDLRKEYVAAGMSDFFQLAQSAELLTGTPSAPTGKPTAETVAGWTAFRSELAETVKGVEMLGGAAATFNGAGLGRPDQVALARFSLAALDTRLAVAREDAPAARSAMQAALDSSREAFSLQADYQSQGTATVYDLARTLRLRSDLLSQPGIRPADALRRELSTDMQSVVQLADRTTDTRGRRAADVSYVQAVAAQEAVRGWLKN